MQLFEELSDAYFQPEQVSSVVCHKLTESIGVQLRGAPSDPAVVGTLAGEVKLHEDRDNGLLSAQIRLRQDQLPVSVTLGNAPTLSLQPKRPQKNALPELIKADCWNYVLLDKSCLKEVLNIVTKHKIVQRAGVTFYFDESLEWLIEDGTDFLKVFGKSDKYGLLKDVRERLKYPVVPEVAVANVKSCIEKEIDVLKSVEFKSFTSARRSLIPLEADTDLAVQELLGSLS